MTTYKVSRLIVDPYPNSGCWNMAIDEALLESSLAEHVCNVRCYRWSEPTISLGYFQDSAAGAGDPSLGRLPRVRRLSGGGAILHDQELTYSCTIAADHPLAKQPGELYGMVHERIIELLDRCGMSARLRGAASDSGDASFLCFHRADARDVVVANHKILGSAQRRRRGAVLQHGSLLLRASPHAPQFPGVLDECPGAEIDDVFAVQLVREIGGLLGGRVELACVTERVGRHALELEQQRYRRVQWRTRHVASSCQDRLRGSAGHPEAGQCE